MAARRGRPPKRKPSDSPELSANDPIDSGEDAVFERDEAPKRPPGRVPRAPPAHQYSDMVGESAELVDFSAWPAPVEAAKLAGCHPSTLKRWRNEGRIRAQMNPATGIWHYDPESLAEVEPETDPATLLATGMTSIVQQGERAGSRLLAMTELTTDAFERAASLLGDQLAAAYERIAVLEKERAEIWDRASAGMEVRYKHERWLRRIDHDHELELTEKRDGSKRLEGLLEILGPIGASIAARVVGNEQAAVAAETKAINGPPEPTPTVETRIAQSLATLKTAIRSLDDTEFRAFQLMLPEDTGKALYAVRTQQDGASVGSALAHIARVSCALPREQFDAIIPIAPKAIAMALIELRRLINEEPSS